MKKPAILMTFFCKSMPFNKQPQQVTDEQSFYYNIIVQFY